MKEPNVYDTFKDYAHRSQLVPYDDGRLWLYLRRNDDITLGQLADIVLRGDAQLVTLLMDTHRLLVKPTIWGIPGDHFLCIYFEDAYLLEPFSLAEVREPSLARHGYIRRKQRNRP